MGVGERTGLTVDLDIKHLTKEGKEVTNNSKKKVGLDLFVGKLEKVKKILELIKEFKRE